MKRFCREYKISGVIAFLQWLVTTVLEIDRYFFNYEYKTKHLIIIKIFYFIFLQIAWGFLFNCVRKIKERNEQYLRGLHFFIPYLCITMILLLVLWPGTWFWDDLGTLRVIRNYNSFHPWQHILSGVYMGVMLQMLPLPGGIILLQNIIISICVAYVVVTLEKIYKIRASKYLLIDYWKLLPFLLPPVLMYQFSGYRMGIYVYLELTMLVKLLSMYKEMREWHWGDIFLLCFLCILVSAWRTESFAYIPCTCVLAAFAGKEVLKKHQKILCIFVLIVGFWGINRWQSIEVGDSNYQIMSLMCPEAELVRAADMDEDFQELEAMDKVTDIEIIRNNPSYGGEALYWDTECVRNGNNNPDDDYSPGDYSNYLKAFIKLSLKYPQVVLTERWNMFIKGLGITGNTVTNVGAATIFDGKGDNSEADATIALNLVAFKPIFKRARTGLIYILSARGIDGTARGTLQRLVWNAAIPMIILLYVWLKLLIKRQWMEWFLCTSVLVRIPIVFLTQPAGWFMYVLSFYFLGYVCLVYLLLIHTSRKKEVSDS